MHKSKEDTNPEQDEFQVGDVVWDVAIGEGKVINIYENDYYPIHVEFVEGNYETYRKGGNIDDGRPRTLFFSEPKIEAAVTRPFVPTLVGKRVVVVPKYDTNLRWLHTVYEEYADRIYINESCSEGSYYRKEDLYAIYEVQPENLLKK